ncbi:MAG: hypothetical protein J1E80_05450 [Desulfovibrionaceae bacterium]|nr:hypothetical protein [Desulfovibrionaceae bacterium]
MRYTIAPAVFDRYPLFRRAVLVARGVDNSREIPEVLALLREAEATARRDELAGFMEHPGLAAWAELFRSMNLNPKRYPPSVINLIKRVRKGAELPYVNTLVALFNCVSLRHLVPCGGDDLDAVSGDLRLDFATGDENYVPLGQPDTLEHPPAGEIVYMDTGSRNVFCRAWCWKNGDPSKLLPSTTRAAINVDFMGAAGEALLPVIADELSGWLARWTGAKAEIHILSPNRPGFVLE